MPMTHRQSSIVFWVIVLTALAFVCLEIYVVVELLSKPSSLKAVIAVTDGLVLASAFPLLKNGWETEFISGPLITGKALHDCFYNRFEIVHAAPALNPDKEVGQSSSSLIRAYLRLLEDLLSKKVGRHDFELSVFCNADEPRIVAYYDSSKRIWPRSHAQRAANPHYYVEKNYAVVELLKNPSAEFIVKSDLQSKTERYEFVTDRQRRQIKSTILHVISAEWPAAIVITCNKTGAFQDGDEVTKELIRGLGSAILIDLHLAHQWNMQTAHGGH